MNRPQHKYLSALVILVFTFLVSQSTSNPTASNVRYIHLRMPREDPVDYIPIALMHSVSDVTASYMPIWRNYSIEENAYAFARSIGATAFQNFKTKEEQDIFSSFFNSLVATFQNVSGQSNINKMHEDNSANKSNCIVIPILINNRESLLFRYSHNSNTQPRTRSGEEKVSNIDSQLVSEVTEFVDKNIRKLLSSDKNEYSVRQIDIFQEMLLAQIKIAIRNDKNSKEVFISESMEDSTDPFRGKLMPLLGKDYNYFMEMKKRKEYFDLYLEKHNKKNSCTCSACTVRDDNKNPIDIIYEPYHAMSLLGTYYASSEQRRKLDIFVINLLSSSYRRLHIRSELERANMNMSHVHYIPGIDGTKVPIANLKSVLKESRGTLIHQGCVGCTLSHVSIYRDVLKLGLPYAMILEDDAVVLPSAKEYILHNINAIYKYIEVTPRNKNFDDKIDGDNDHPSRVMHEQWDIIVTDFGSSKHVGIENLRKMKTNIPEQCVKIFYDRNHNPHSFVDITGSPCAHFGAVSYVVSYQGAKKLLKYLIPFKNCIDVEILNLIEEGKLRTFALVPFVTGQLNAFEKSRKGSDMTYRFISLENGELKFTYSNRGKGDQKHKNCLQEKCSLRIFLEK